MSDEWTTALLGDVTKVVGGGTPSTKVPEYWNGSIPWLTPTEVVKADGQRIASSERFISEAGLSNSSAKLLPTNAVLVTTRASVGFVALAGGPVATNQGFQSLITKEHLLPEFLMLWIQGNRNEFTSRAGGSTFPEISKNKVLTIPISFPPLPVQRRIVDLMTHLDNHIANTELSLNALRKLESATIDRMHALETVTHPDSKLSDYAVVFDCEHKTAPAAEPGEEHGYSIGTRDVRDGLIHTDKAKKVSEATWHSWSRRVKVGLGDIILAREAPVGAIAYVGELNSPLCLGQRTVLIRPRVGVNGAYFASLLRSTRIQSWMQSESAGLTVAHLNVADIRGMPLGTFEDSSVQESIAVISQELLKQRVLLLREISELRSLRSTCLASLMSGDLLIGQPYESTIDEGA